MLAVAHRYDGFGVGGGNISPHLRWSGFPAETRSFAVTCFDPDAPTISGFWHWVLFDLPAEITEMTAGTGDGNLSRLPAGAVHARNDFGVHAYGGPAPQPGSEPHRYLFSVHALDVPQLEAAAETSAALVGFHLIRHALARATMVPLCGP
jgi:Raf kinase inhibitor-like YbhB/YbcL family protein